MVEKKARIMIVDDHPVMRHGLGQLIEQQPDLEVCGEAEGVTEARRLFDSMGCDVAVIDLSLKDGHGLDLIKDLQASKSPPKMLVMSMHDEPSYAERALRAGARGYLPKSEAVDQIIEAIHRVLKGEVYLTPRLTTRLLHGIVGGGLEPGCAPEDVLSDRELQVFELLGQGLSSRAISQQLTLSVKTIDTHREHIKAKLGLPSGVELVRRAILWCHSRR